MPGSRDECHLCHIHDHSHPSSLLRTSTLRDNSPPPHRPRRHSHSRSRSGSIDNQYRNSHPDHHHHHHNHHHHDRDRGHHHHSRVGRVPSALARLSEHSSHSLPASRSNTLNLYPEQVSVLPDGGHRYIGGDRSSVRSLELTSPRHAPDNRSHHSLHQTTSLQKPSGVLRASPDILTASLPPLRSHGGSHLSLNHAPPGLTAVQDHTQDYYMQVNRLPSFKDDSRKHRFNLQTAMLIGCYTLLFVMAIIIGVVLCHQNGWLGFGSPETLSATEDPLDPNGVLGSVRGDAIDGIGGHHSTDIDPDIRLKRLKDGTSSQIPVHNVVQVRTPENGQLNVAGVFTGSSEGGRPRSISGAGRVANIPGNRPVQAVSDTTQQGGGNVNQPSVVSNQGHNNPSLDQSNIPNMHQGNSNNPNPNMNHGNNQMHQINHANANNNQNSNQGNNNNPNFNQANNNEQNLHQANSNQNFNRVNPNNQNFNQAQNNNNQNVNPNTNNNPNVNHNTNLGIGMNSRELNKVPDNHQNMNHPVVGNNNNNKNNNNNNNMNHPVIPQGNNNFHGILHLNNNNQPHGNQHQLQHHPPPPNVGMPHPPLIEMPPRDVPVPSLVPAFGDSTRGELQPGGGKEASFIGNPPPSSAQNNPFVVFSSPVHSNSQQHIPGPFQSIPSQNGQSPVILQGGIVQQIPTGNSEFVTVFHDRPHIGSHSTQIINQTQPQLVSFVPDSHVVIGQNNPQNDHPLQLAGFSNTHPFANSEAPLFPPPLPASHDQNGQQASIITVSQGNSILNGGPPPITITSEPKPVFDPPQPVFPPPFISANKKQPNHNKPQFNSERNKPSENVQISHEQPAFKPQFNIANEPNNKKASDQTNNAQLNEIHMEKMKMLKEILDAEGSGKLLQDLIALKNNRVSLTTISQDLSEATTKHGPSPSIHTPAPQRNLPTIASPPVHRHRDALNSSSAIFINTHNQGSNKAKNTNPISLQKTSGNTQLRQPSNPGTQSSETGSNKSKSNIQVVRELLASLISSPEVQEILNTRNRQLAKQAQANNRGGRTTDPTGHIPLKGDEMRAFLLKALAKEIPNGQSVQSLRLHGPQPSLTRQTVPPSQSTLRRGEKAGQVRATITRAEEISHFNTTIPAIGRPRSLPPTPLHFSNRMGVAATKNGLTSIEHQSVRPPTASITSRTSTEHQSVRPPTASITSRTTTEHQSVRPPTASRTSRTSTEHQSVRPPTASRTSRGRERKPTPDFTLKVTSDGEAAGSGQRDRGEDKKMVTESVDMRTGRDALEGDVVRKWMHMDDDGTVSQGTVRRDGSFAFTNCRPAKMCQEQQPTT